MVGVNRYRPADEPPLEVLRVDNSAVRAAQIEKLKRLRAERDEAATQAALARPHRRRAKGGGNLLALSVEAARAKATVGEISLALEDGLRPLQRRCRGHFRRLPRGDRRRAMTSSAGSRRLVAGFEAQ